ncbi:hypothetical protein O6H91_11G114300 [Diphasiastrum complanatum]|uniref:Uncharacterized protein n=1 Tax=Diphasiastrum complanatum TaxID=34168 RepID=A0ACC2CDK6_DIPCM|nr:hypothetical protein O6H91_11G114300 [Diphasiastrum complanatum]
MRTLGIVLWGFSIFFLSVINHLSYILNQCSAPIADAINFQHKTCVLIMYCCDFIRFVDLQLAGSMDIKRRNIQHLLRLQARILYSSMFLGKSHLCRYRQ